MAHYLGIDKRWRNLAEGFGQNLFEDTIVSQSESEAAIRFIADTPDRPGNDLPNCCIELDKNFLLRFVQSLAELKLEADGHVAGATAYNLRRFRGTDEGTEISATHYIMMFHEEGLHSIL